MIGGGPARPRKALLLALRDDVDGVVDLVGLADRGRTLGGHETDQGCVVAAEHARDGTRQLRPDVRAQVEIAQRRDGDQAVDGGRLGVPVRVIEAGLQRMGVEAVEHAKGVSGQVVRHPAAFAMRADRADRPLEPPVHVQPEGVRDRARDDGRVQHQPMHVRGVAARVDLRHPCPV